MVEGEIAAVASLTDEFLMPQLPLDRRDNEKLKKWGKKADKESKGLRAADEGN